MKSLVFAVFTMVGSPPVVTQTPAMDCKPAMEQIVKSYGMASFIKSWSNSSMKAEKDGAKLVVTCQLIK